MDLEWRRQIVQGRLREGGFQSRGRFGEMPALAEILLPFPRIPQFVRCSDASNRPWCDHLRKHGKQILLGGFYEPCRWTTTTSHTPNDLVHIFVSLLVGVKSEVRHRNGDADGELICAPID